jgi:hypothetical protein
MTTTKSSLAACLPVAAALLLSGCDGADREDVGTRQLNAEQKDVKEAQGNLEEAREDVAEQKKELHEAKQDVAEQTRELEAAEDAAGDAERQLAKEQADAEAERTDADPAPQNR